jgi:hypothetical protein
VAYLNSIQYRKFFAWLLFNDAVNESFCSIFHLLNQGCLNLENCERWTFDFQPPDLSLCEISWTGYTGRENFGEKHHCYIREIRSIAGLSAPELEVVTFSHPDDIHYLKSEANSEEKEKLKQRNKNIEPSVIDPHNPPKAGKRRYMIRLTASGLNFDTEIDLRRSPRQINALPFGEVPDMAVLEVDDTVGVTEQSEHGEAPRADVENLEEPEKVDAPEKMALFKEMLEKLQEERCWGVDTVEGEVPKVNCRSAHLIDKRARKYCHGMIKRDQDSIVNVLEIELKPGEVLSTLLFRSDDDDAVDKILDALMSVDSEHRIRAMHWNHKKNAKLTKARSYLVHPNNMIEVEQDAMDSWVACAAAKIERL